MHYPIYKSEHKIFFCNSNFFATFVTYLITNMNTRLKQFLSAENITQAQFADKLNVVRASVSHILAGRNNPSYDFLKALLENYPNLNTDWLFFGKGKMYKELQTETIPQLQQEKEPLLFDVQESEIAEEHCHTQEKTEAPTEIESLNQISQPSATQRKVSKIIILFDDGTYQEM